MTYLTMELTKISTIYSNAMSLCCYKVFEDKKTYENHIIKNSSSRGETVNTPNNKVLRLI